jgi:hypothetical protein
MKCRTSRMNLTTLNGQFWQNNTLYNVVKVGPPAHNYEHEAGSYGDGFT